MGCKTTGSACITTCEGKENGDYQSCLGCGIYASCSFGRLIDNRPCVANSYWDDNKGWCATVSETCKCSLG